METPQVVHNETRHRFEIEGEDGVALAEYARRGDVLILTHTEVPAAYEGQGWGSALARAAFEFARAEGVRVRPACAFMAAYAVRHPEVRDLLAGHEG